MIAVRNENSRYIYIPMDDTGSTLNRRALVVGCWLLLIVLGVPVVHISDDVHFCTPLISFIY